MYRTEEIETQALENVNLHIDEGDIQVAKQSGQECVSGVARNDDVVTAVFLQTLGAVIHGDCRIGTAI